MPTVSIEQLKKRFASILKRARSGRPVVITRHNKPVAFLIGTDNLHVHVGARSGKTRLNSVLQAPSRGRYLEVLVEDRAENHPG